MKEYLIDMVNPEYAQVLQFVLAVNIPHQMNQTQMQFSIPEGNVEHRFMDRFEGVCRLVDSTPLQ